MRSGIAVIGGAFLVAKLIFVNIMLVTDNFWR